MASIKIILDNGSGEIDSRTVTAAARGADDSMAVTEALIEMIRETPLYVGDSIRIEEAE